MAAFRRYARIGKVLAGVSIVGVVASGRAAGQSVTQGALRGTVELVDRLPVAEASLTIEDEGGGVVRRVRTDADGAFNIALLTPGTYAILVEKAGYQPLRQHGVIVLADQRSEVRLQVTRRPPPITSVEELAVADLRFRPGTPRTSEVLGGDAFVRDGNRLDLAESGRFATGIVTPTTTRWGLGEVVGSLPQDQSRLLIDGLPVTWARHPGLETEPAGNQLVPPFLQREARLILNGSDAEPSWTPGGLVGVVSRPGTRSLRVESFLNAGTAAGLSGVRNPGDSTLRALQAGAIISGTIVKDKAQFIAGGGLEKLDLPSPRPWSRDSATFNGADTLLVPALVGIAQDSFGTDVGRFTRPPLRTYRGGIGLLGVDWQLSGAHRVTARAVAGRHREQSPEFGRDVLTGAGGRLESRDFLGSIAITSTGRTISNEFRIGVQSSRRDWRTTGGATTYLVSEGAGVGTVPAWPGEFKWSGFEAMESFQYQFGEAGHHRMKFGLAYSDGTWEHDYVYGRQGIFQFGGLDQFANGTGAYYGVTATRTDVSFKMREIDIFGHLDYRLTPSLAMLAGLRWDRQRLPDNRLVFDTVFAPSFGIRNNTEPNDAVNLSPRLGLLWTGSREQGWMASLIGSISHGGVSPGRFAEAMLSNRQLMVRRAVGTFTTWPAPDPAVTPDSGRRFAIFGPDGEYRDPRATKLDLEIRREAVGGISLRLTGRYHHTDYLLRRTDINLLPVPTGTTQEGRPIYGTLVKSGAMVVAVPGSNRRLADFDLVSAFSSTGAQDFSEVTVGADRRFGPSLSVSASYSLSRTRDNWPQSWTGDPTDELPPFPEEPIGGGWAKGVSDFDAPHRVLVAMAWQSGGRFQVRAQGRYRYQSGLPYTPGFQPGVDVNADGSGRNDPAFVDANIPGMPAQVLRNDCLADQLGKFAERNSCREDGRHALDVGASVGVPIRSIGGRVEITLDVVNLVSSRSGVVDRALVLIDPQAALVTDPQGNVTLPLVANPRFGTLLSRRDEPRIVRLGLRFGNW
jgi:hypothetical protein